jgi:ribosomal protein L31
MIATIHQPQYLPWLGYFDKMARADLFIVLDNVQFKKNEWQNRNRIKSPEGWQWLTVPVYQQHGQLIREVKINNSVDWLRKQLNALQQNYKKAPYYQTYMPGVEQVLMHQYDSLLDITMSFIHQIRDWLEIDTQMIMASETDDVVKSTGTERLVELCLAYGADTYLSGQGGQNYCDFAMFEEHNIMIEVQDYQHPFYSQAQNGKQDQAFVSHLSVLDLLFHCGPESRSILMNPAFETTS